MATPTLFDGCAPRKQKRRWSRKRIADPTAQFWKYVNKGGSDECWEWTAAKGKTGYGHYHHRGFETTYVHRISYMLLKGAIPDGLEIDHLCRNRRCVNPAHLEAVTTKVNTLRSNSISALNARKTHCPHGHAYVEGNIYRRGSSGRECRTCVMARRRDYVERKRKEKKTHADAV